MYCANCGTQSQAGHTVCVKCGKPLTEHPYQAPRAAVSAIAPATSGDTPFASFWIRFGAYIIDSIILFVVYMLSSVVLAVAASPGAALASFGLWVLVPYLYYAIFESANTQATPGKLAVGLRVTNEAGEPLGFGAATGRYFGKIVSSFTLLIGYLMVLFTERRQTLHDKMAGALVVYRRWPTEEIANAGPAPKQSAVAIVMVVVLVCFIPIVGILAAIAIPAYQDYTIRAQVTEGLVVVGPYKAAIAEAFADGQEFGAMSTESLQLSAPTTLKYVDQIDVVNGAIRIRYGGQANSQITGQSLVIRPGVTEQKDVVWMCGYQEAPDGVNEPADVPETSVKQKYLPQSCRGT
jgi:uncharacterized RDD family membrane protein YckC/Tfp pilus assembly major pilin PilA